jgi:hypothetical protein
MKRMLWLSDMDEAARHPWRVSLTVFLGMWLVVTPYSYFRWDHRSLVVSAIVGSGFGLLVVLICLSGIGQLRGWQGWISGEPGRMPRLPLDLSVLWAGAGVGIVVWGATRGSLQLALVGLPLIALGLFWRLIKRSLPR